MRHRLSTFLLGTALLLPVAAPQVIKVQGQDLTTTGSPTFVALTATGAVGATSYTLGTTLTLSSTAPTISSGFGTSPSIAANNGTAAFTINVGTGGTAQNGVIGLPTAAAGWVVNCQDITTNASFVVSQTASSTTTATVQNYSRTTGLAIAWTASDILHCTAVAR